tara:strand:+ start:160 stop:402 length:243 start_codon:yes stop_codon:yes gene_type:complete
MAALSFVIIATPAEPVKPVIQANRSFSGGIYSERYSSSCGIMSESSSLLLSHSLILFIRFTISLSFITLINIKLYLVKII